MHTDQPPIPLRISFTPLPGGTALRWEADVLGVRLSRLAPPLLPADLRTVLRALDLLQDPRYPTGGLGRASELFSPDEIDRLRRLDLWDEGGLVHRDAPRRVGRRLFQALTADPVGAQALGTLRDHAAAQGHPVTIEICFPPGMVDLAALPWELLWDEQPTPLLLGRHVGDGIIRRLDLPSALPPAHAPSGPLRILAVSPRADVPAGLRTVERAARTGAWQGLLGSGRATLSEVEPADRSALIQALQAGPPPDIVHFYGHGRYQGGQGALLLDGAEGWTAADTLAAALSATGMVVLHACQGAALDPLAAPGGMLSGVAQALSAAGVPVVLAMQFTVRAQAAARFAGLVYAALAAGRNVADAVSIARRVLFVEEPDRVSWFVPTLYLRSSTPPTLRPQIAPPPAVQAVPASAARQSVVARSGGVIQDAQLRGGASSRQQILAESGGAISGVSISSG